MRWVSRITRKRIYERGGKGHFFLEREMELKGGGQDCGIPRSVMVGAKRRAARSMPDRGEVAEPGAAELRGPPGGAAKAAIWRCARTIACEPSVDGQHAVSMGQIQAGNGRENGTRGGKKRREVVAAQGNVRHRPGGERARSGARGSAL
jgi:hypothetical protein